MKKLEKFSWKIWHLYALVSVTIFMIGGTCSFFYLKEAGDVVNERNYTYVGKGQRLTDFKKVEGVDAGFPILAISFKDGKSSYLENSEELHQVVQQEKVEREHEDEE